MVQRRWAVTRRALEAVSRRRQVAQRGWGIVERAERSDVVRHAEVAMCAVVELARWMLELEDVLTVDVGFDEALLTEEASWGCWVADSLGSSWLT